MCVYFLIQILCFKNVYFIFEPKYTFTSQGFWKKFRKGSADMKSLKTTACRGYYICLSILLPQVFLFIGNTLLDENS